jgi:nucleotide-binding universal stress UspA family protein
MSEEQEQAPADDLEKKIRRILVALDASSGSLAALRASAGLAAALQAELVGLFVEDVNLIRLSALPFAQEVRWPSARRQQLNEQLMEQQLRLRASVARRALALAADQLEVAWTFTVVRGRVTEAVMEACLDADLLSLGRASRTMARRSRMGSTARAVAERSPRSVLLARQASDMDWPVVVTYDGSELARRGLAAGIRLAQRYENNLIVLILGEDRESAAPLVGEVQAQIEPIPLHVDFRFVSAGDADQLVAIVRDQSCSLVILAGETPSLRGEALQLLLDGLECPVMVMR